MPGTSRPARRLLVVLFIAGLLIITDQLAELVATLLSRSADVASPTWRFGLFGLLAGRTGAMLLGDVMLFTAAVGLGWRRGLRALGALHLILAATGLVGLTLFTLDAVQIRKTVPSPSSGLFFAAVLRAGVVALGGLIVTTWAGVAAWRTAIPKSHRDGQSGESLLVRDSLDRPGG